MKTIKPALMLFIILAGWLLLSAAPARADMDFKENTPDGRAQIIVSGEIPVLIRAGEVLYDEEKALLTLSGGVTFTRGAEMITAERALWHDRTKTAELAGQVEFTTPDFIVKADRAAANMETQLAKIYGGRAFYPSRNYYVDGAVVERLGPEKLYVKNAVATTCEGPQPSWSFEADELTVERGGYAKASGVKLNTRYFPVMYTPFFIFPVKNERQSGFLIPTVTNSTRDGFLVGLPVFWATGENHDLTFLPVWRDKRGPSFTLEGRYNLEPGRGVWLATFMDDRKGTYYRYDGELTDQTQKGRYWLRSQNTWLAGGWDVNLDLDIVSDPILLNEFRSDPDGFHYSRDLFKNDFGRTLNEPLNPIRTNTLFAQKIDQGAYFRATAKYDDHLFRRHNLDVTQNYASLYYSLADMSLADKWGRDLGLWSPRFSMDMRYDFFGAKTSSLSLADETGHRFRFNPGLFMSRQVGDIFTLNIYGDAAANFYSVSGYRPSAIINCPDARHDGWAALADANIGADISTTFSKIYTGGFGSAEAMRHQITPMVSFNYTAASGGQRDLPYWDGFDRRLKRSNVKFGVLNTLTAKTTSPGEDEFYEYRQILKLGLWGNYEFASNEAWGNDPFGRYYTTGYYDKGFGTFDIDLEASLGRNLTARVLSSMDGRSGEFISHDIAAEVRTDRGDRFSVVYDYESAAAPHQSQTFVTPHEEIRGEVEVPLGQDWRAIVSSRFDFRNNERLESYAQLRYEAQCYSIGLIYSDSVDDNRIGVVIDLLGLGGLDASPAAASDAGFNK